MISMEDRWDSKGRFYSYLDDTLSESYHYILLHKIDTVIVYFLHNVRGYTISRLATVNTIISWKDDFIDDIDMSSSWLTYLRFPSIQYSVASSLYLPIFVIILKSTAENMNAEQEEVYSILYVVDDLGRRESGKRLLEGTAYKLRVFFQYIHKC